MNQLSSRSALLSIAAAVSLAWAPPSDARVTKIIIDRPATPLTQAPTEPIAYETITGRAFGELDPGDRHNDEITDLSHAQRNANGKVEYWASFFIVKPVDMSKSSGLMWHDVPNRGGRITISSDLRAQGDIGLSSGWQGDNAGATLKVHLKETINGKITEGATIPNSDWKFCGGGTFAAPTPVTTLPVNLCLKDGFEAAKLYQLTYTVKDPYVLGAGTAAFRDVASFFRNASAADGNFLAGKVNRAIIRGSSQSGNFTRHFIFLGMNEDEA